MKKVFYFLLIFLIYLEILECRLSPRTLETKIFSPFFNVNASESLVNDTLPSDDNASNSVLISQLSNDGRGTKDAKFGKKVKEAKLHAISSSDFNASDSVINLAAPVDFSTTEATIISSTRSDAEATKTSTDPRGNKSLMPTNVSSSVASTIGLSALQDAGDKTMNKMSRETKPDSKEKSFKSSSVSDSVASPIGLSRRQQHRKTHMSSTFENVTATDDFTETVSSSTVGSLSQKETTLIGNNMREFKLEFEDGLTPEQSAQYMVYRSKASENMTMHLKDVDAGKRFAIKLCAAGTSLETVVIQVADVIYSNDGPSDALELYIDDTFLGGAFTEELFDSGFGWNVFKSTGPIGGDSSLSDGNHTLIMTVTADQWGAEFDALVVRIVNQNPEVDLLCGAELL